MPPIVKVRGLGHKFDLDVELSWSVSKLISEICVRSGIPPNSLKLCIDKKIYDDDKSGNTLLDQIGGIDEGTKIFILGKALIEDTSIFNPTSVGKLEREMLQAYLNEKTHKYFYEDSGGEYEVDYDYKMMDYYFGLIEVDDGLMDSWIGRQEVISTNLVFLSNFQNEQFRRVIVNWMVESMSVLSEKPDCLYLAVLLFDKFFSNPQNKLLENVEIHSSTFYIVAATCMMLAEKQEDTFLYPMYHQLFGGYPRNIPWSVPTFTLEEVEQKMNAMEENILSTLNFTVGSPTIWNFLNTYVKYALRDDQHPTIALAHMAGYLTELSFYDYRCVILRPSVVAAAAVYLAHKTLHPRSDWSETLRLRSHVRAEDVEVEECMEILYNLQCNSNRNYAVYNKYSEPEFQSVAISPRLASFPGRS